ncbi:adenosylcobinamide-GDP ribazoletransferase [Streptosporangium sp. KLBMP 9127]|nr:adenosylcobinamide-GDP ribazoletransferase [Streptosporangium sp. KLBMP 9127]
MDGFRFAVGTLTVFPVRVARVDRRVAGRGMIAAPVVGALLGLAAGVSLALLQLPSGGGLLAAALAIGLLALLTRGLHLDGLADLADGLGSGRPAAGALEIMRRSDIGPFGVATLVLTLIVQVAALAETGPAGPFALIAACVSGRLALTWACREGVPSARPDGLGAMVAGTVRRGAALGVTVLALVTVSFAGFSCDIGAFGPWPRYCAPAGALFPGQDALEPGLSSGADGREESSFGWFAYAPEPAFPVPGLVYGTAGTPSSGQPLMVVLPAAILAGLVVAWLLRRRAVRRLGGVTGDVLGALVEAATATALVVCALIL